MRPVPGVFSPTTISISERWLSGRKRSPAKGVRVKSPSRVRIPLSPPENKKAPSWGLFIFWPREGWMQIAADGGRPARRPSGVLRASKIVPDDFVDSRSAAGASEGAKRPSLCCRQFNPTGCIAGRHNNRASARFRHPAGTRRWHRSPPAAQSVGRKSTRFRYASSGNPRSRRRR